MSRSTSIALIAAGAVALTAFPAAAADAPAIGAQTTWTGATTPVSVPGNHLHKGDRIPRGRVLVYRAVTVPVDARATRTRLTMPQGRRLTGIAFAIHGGADVQLAPGQTVHYVGHRSVQLIVRDRLHRAGRAKVYAYGR